MISEKHTESSIIPATALNKNLEEKLVSNFDTFANVNSKAVKTKRDNNTIFEEFQLYREKYRQAKKDILQLKSTAQDLAQQVDILKRKNNISEEKYKTLSSDFESQIKTQLTKNKELREEIESLTKENELLDEEVISLKLNLTKQKLENLMVLRNFDKILVETRRQVTQSSPNRKSI